MALHPSQSRIPEELSRDPVHAPKEPDGLRAWSQSSPLVQKSSVAYREQKPGPKARPGLGRTYGMIFVFSFGGRTENGHKIVFDLVSGADFASVLHHVPSLTCLKGSWGRVWSETGPKPKLKSRF